MSDYHVRVGTSDHPDGPVALWVKDRVVYLTTAEALSLADSITTAAASLTKTPVSSETVDAAATP
jgi:hypothetical protein